MQVLLPVHAVIKNSAAQAASATSVFIHPLAIFILQLIIIIIASRAFGWLFTKIGQPAVMGEIVAGIALGPSLLGMLWPGCTAFLFPAASLGNLNMLAQVGLILFMFVIGMELDLELLKRRMSAAVIISHSSIIAPFALGILLSLSLYRHYAPPGVPFYAFSLFLGISMSITAFPVLARILRERGLSQTALGTTAITCAAIGDVTAWCMLAFIVAIATSQSAGGSLMTLLYVVIYGIVMLAVIKPLLRQIAVRGTENGNMSRATIAIVFILLLASSYACEVIGIHALFGAFFAGVIMPVAWNFRREMIARIEDVALVLLLPLFFVATGLRTNIGLLNSVHLWAVCGVIILVAVAGKFGGSALAARVTGETARDSIAIGALMNTRGLMELVVLNLGYDMGILSREIFTMMVIMAIVTTLMAGPILTRLARKV